MVRRHRDDSDQEEWSPHDDNKKRRKHPHDDEPNVRKVIQSLQGLNAKSKQEALSRADNEGWINNLLRIPFGKYAELPVQKNSRPHDIRKYFDHVVKTLDKAVYGMQPAKEEILNYIAQTISCEHSRPRVLALCGSAGVGKTALIRRGLSEALKRPMECINMGGIRDANYFLGHDYTYIGSRHGILVQSVMNMQVMNGILFMDEVDKVGGNRVDESQEIFSLLMHLTDPVQNHEFHDKYFAGIDIDLSRMIFVFSFNDEKRIDPILRDRMHVVNIEDPTMKEKIVIGTKYLIPEIERNIGLAVDKDFTIGDEVVEHILKVYCEKQKGVRRLKSCLETMLLKINTARYLPIRYQKYASLKEKTPPIAITVTIADELLKHMKPKEDKYISTMYI